MKELKKSKVDGREYEIRPMQTSEALKILARLSQTVLPPLGAVLSNLGLGSGKLNMDVDMSQLSLDQAASELAKRLDEDLVVNTIRELIDPRYVRKGTGVEIDFENDFSGDLMHLMKLLREVLEVNYGDFFAGLGGLVKAKVKGKA